MAKDIFVLSRRSLLLIAVSSLSAPAFAAEKRPAKSGPSPFLGKWVGYWDGRWRMSIEVVSVGGGKAQVNYTHPEGHSSEVATVSGNTLRFRVITLTLTAPNAGVAVGKFAIATRTANVTRE